jgi:4-amino-4-deoxy-L-arabinose transferase-like glycosyltransferase
MSPSLLIPFLLAAGCFALRLAFLGRYPEGWDSINFLLALRRYDLTEGQPHFPGYPVYLFVGWLFHRLLRQDVSALLVAGCLFSSLALLPLYRLTSRLFAPRIAVGACLLYIANPLLFLEAEKVFSDAFALLFLVAVADFTEAATRTGSLEEGEGRRAATRAGYLAGFSAGLMLGVRLSLWPIVLSAALWLWWRRRAAPSSPSAPVPWEPVELGRVPPQAPPLRRGGCSTGIGAAKEKQL